MRLGDGDVSGSKAWSLNAQAMHISLQDYFAVILGCLYWQS